MRMWDGLKDNWGESVLKVCFASAAWLVGSGVNAHTDFTASQQASVHTAKPSLVSLREDCRIPFIDSRPKEPRYYQLRFYQLKEHRRRSSAHVQLWQKQQNVYRPVHSSRSVKGVYAGCSHVHRFTWQDEGDHSKTSMSQVRWIVDFADRGKYGRANVRVVVVDGGGGVVSLGSGRCHLEAELVNPAPSLSSCSFPYMPVHSE